MIDFQQLQSKNVLVIGDIMLDSYWRTITKGQSPEAPVDIWKLDTLVNTPGGAGNVAWNIRSLKSNPILLGVIGNDNGGKMLLQTLEEKGINTTYILEEENRKTTQKIRVYNDGRLQHRIDNEQTSAIEDAIQKELLESIEEILEHQKIDVAILQDYNKGVLFKKNIPTIINKLKEHYIPIAVDPKFDNFSSFNGVQLFKPNWKEYAAYTSISDSSEDDLLISAKQALADLEVENLLITLSDKGAFFYNKNIHGLAATKIITNADVCGAGDTVITVAALGLANNWQLSEIAHTANLCAGKVCSKKGVQPITSADLLIAN